jgi:hypothetical protein
MLLRFIIYILILFSVNSFSQKALSSYANSPNIKSEKDSTKQSLRIAIDTAKKAPINLYKIYNLKRDTTYVDTTLTIKSEYKYNFLRKDNFGLLEFANDGYTYNTLNYSLNTKSAAPNMGFKGKHFSYQEIEDVKYYSVPTPLTELYFKTVTEQGQSVDALLTLNTKPNLNFSIEYKGLRSLGKYLNSLSSSGNFKVTSSYFSKDKRYILNTHFTGQDISNQENGGIIDVALFELSQSPLDKREQFEVYFEDAKSFLKGNRFFIDHSFKLSKTNPNSLVVTHQFIQEYKFFQFTQNTLSERLGSSFSNKINNKTRFNSLYNKVGIAYKTKKYGDVEFFIDDNNYNYYYNSVIYDASGNITVPNSLNDRINSFGGSYTYYANPLIANLKISNTLSNQSISNIEANLSYKYNDDYKFNFQYQKINSLPSLNYTLHQSSYINYNWFNNFKNEKTNQFQIEAETKWLNVSLHYKILNDYLYFYNTTNDITSLLIKPQQYDKTINYLAVKASKELKFWKFALDNTILFQNVQQTDNVLNVPQIVTRNSFYFTDKVFKKAMLIQTGFTLNYFTEYYANDYNPVIGEFYTQTETKIGAFPLIDFFINAKVKQARIFLKAEHFNSSLTGYNFYSAPNYPYRDFVIRFGLVWNFFQ